MRGSYPDAWFLSRRTGIWGYSYPHDETTNFNVDFPAPASQKVATKPTRLVHPSSWLPPTSIPIFPHQKAEKSPQNQHVLSYNPTTAHDTHPPPAHTKRARTNRSGRATYSAQALGRLPWFAPFLRRSRRLRPRFDMSFSLGLLSRLKHFCTHWPKPPRHRPFAATKVTEKRAATPASSARAARRDHALSQRS